jgi:hypothetical protein
MSDSKSTGGVAPTNYPFSELPTWPSTIGTQPAGLPLHACMGLNSCKGADRFGVEGRPDPNNISGPYITNDCAGQGLCATTADHNCHVQNNCAGQGGCGLYGTAKELDNPGNNACRSQGSCATPINAERFSMNGPNQGKSVWLRARAVFEEKWPVLRDELAVLDAVERDKNPLPGSLGSSPLANGPSYYWVSDTSLERGNMTACGASGMSGAGGCT